MQNRQHGDGPHGRHRAIGTCGYCAWPSGAGILAAGAGPGPGRIDFPFGVTPEVLLLKLRRAAAVLAQRVRRAMQERVVASGMKMLKLAKQVRFGQITRAHT
jgi:hypothetical protein